MYCHLQVPKTNKHSKDTTIKKKVLEVSTSSVDLTPKKKIKEEPHIPTLKSTKKQSVGHKKGLTTKQVTGCVVEIKNDNILPILSEFDSDLSKLVKEYSLHNKSKGATSATSETEEKVIGHIEKVKCEADSKPSVGELYKEGSLRQ